MICIISSAHYVVAYSKALFLFAFKIGSSHKAYTSVLSIILWIRPLLLCLSTESISKAITVARRGLFDSKKKGKEMAPMRISAQS